ncbi:MAG: peptide-methionine (R)-S-oxide reductase MsrB, partial [Gammaproteobacteria bacterium]|nr:peptide-methionine (R)-S-oxide reductase MsrB [Gammaproteobacteria bacterium]
MKNKSELEWCKLLTPEQFRVCRQKGTEAPFSGKYLDHKETGIYRCICCKSPLFHSHHKFDSGTGWPSFWQPMDPDNVATRPDNEFSMSRTEVVCSNCDSHLGHVFNDGPPPTNLPRATITPASL